MSGFNRRIGRVLEMPRKIDRTKIPQEGHKGAVFETAIKILTRWGLGAKDQSTILGIDKASLEALKRDCLPVSELPEDLLYRISYVLGIYSALRTLYPEDKYSDSWFKRPNSHSLFRGHAPIDRFLSGRIQDLRVIRAYLDDELFR